MDSNEFYDLVSGFFGPRVTQEGYVEATSIYTCTLYESFGFKCGLDGEHGTFTGGIESGPDQYLTHFLGRRFSFNTDRESILENLRMVDEWCRLRLPDKFLERYEAALGIDAS
jgi:hypothetical protein